MVGPEASPGHDGGHPQQDAVACDLQELFTPDVGDTSVVDWFGQRFRARQCSRMSQLRAAGEQCLSEDLVWRKRSSHS